MVPLVVVVVARHTRLDRWFHPVFLDGRFVTRLLQLLHVPPGETDRSLFVVSAVVIDCPRDGDAAVDTAVDDNGCGVIVVVVVTLIKGGIVKTERWRHGYSVDAGGGDWLQRRCYGC